MRFLIGSNRMDMFFHIRTKRNSSKHKHGCIIVALVLAFSVRCSADIDFGGLSVDDLSEDLFTYDYSEFDKEIEEEIPCSAPPEVANGETIVWGDGLLLEYRCKPDYYPVGITHGACDLAVGKWTIEPPICAETGCPELSAPTYGVVNVDVSGGLATFACRPGHFMLGDDTLICENGQWKGIFPICAETAQPNKRTKTRKTTKKKKKNGDSQFSLDNSDETCFYSGVSPPTIPNAVVNTEYKMNEHLQRYVMVATYTCMGGYRLRSPGHAQLYCMSLKWGADIMPECIAEDDQCEIDNGGCEHMCTPLGKNRYACTCTEGYTLKSDAKSCGDADECAIDNGGCEQECFNTVGSFFCSCLDGFTPKGSTCIDVNECEKSTNQCPGPCINLAGSFRCDCNITGFSQSEAPDHCDDIDECADNNGGCDDVCINKRGSYDCRCDTKGRKLGEDGRSCVDVDECSRYKNKVCTHGLCVNTDGSYTCTCNNGYSQAENNSKCVDINECEEDNGGCEHLCENLSGSHKCECEDGYVISGDDNSQCEDLDECATENGGCQDQCVNNEGSFTCKCTHVGKVLAEDGLTCKPCSPQEFYNSTTHMCNACPAHSTARDGLALSVNDCSCDSGFHGNPKLKVECQDTNECQTGETTCSHECVNTIGSVYCACPAGLQIDEDGVTCVDVDECDLDVHNCSQVCENTDGSYVCSCEPGFNLVNETECVDINECALGLGLCEHTCNNTDGSFFCTCRPGFQLSANLATCQDINECLADVAPCAHRCVNTEGSFRCECEGVGFKLSRDMSTCIDINECMEGDNPCPDICINTVGSFLCDCNRPGYLLAPDGSGCEDINECGQVPSPCPHECVNTPGSYRCRCPPGHKDPPEHDQTICEACGHGTYRGENDAKCLACPEKSNTTGTRSTSRDDCVCARGYREDPYRRTDACVDVDECATNLLDCDHGCVNTPGSAHCTCRPGFTLSRLNKTTCLDADECAIHNGGCEHICVNTPGSFHCKCEGSNFKLAENGMSCEDVNACASRQHGCEYRCVNTRYGAKCTCPAGHTLMQDRKKCKDVNECRKRNGGCTDTCINTEGSYYCECNIPGYQLYQDGRQCTDVDECDPVGARIAGIQGKTCEDMCVNTIGSFTCHCRRQGYKLARDKRSCADIDECAHGQICQHRCINLPGSFRCDCNAGYYKQGHRCTPCAKGSYRDIRESVLGCELCPPGMTTDGRATESLRGCHCPPGFDGNPETRDKCRDVNECAQRNGGCEQLCENTRGSFKCSCNEGYILARDRTSCKPTRCPLLTLPRFGRFKSEVCTNMTKGHYAPPGTSCEYKCRGFLMLEGSRNRTCLSNYTWTGSEPKCEALPCERLPVPTNGYLYPPICMLPRVPFRTRCLIKCKRGYRRKGQRAAKCKANMRWSGKIRRGSPTTCERMTSAALSKAKEKMRKSKAKGKGKGKGEVKGKRKGKGQGKNKGKGRPKSKGKKRPKTGRRKRKARE